jgi:deazaflavin-dependent oxidoreductase (nitroreductase family)
VDAAKPAPAASTAAAWGARLLGVRWLVRAPIVLYRARLGFLFGSRLLLLEHIGRKSGARRYALLEVVGHSRPGTYMVASGFGARAQWYRNIQVNPRVRVSVGSHKPVPATARPGAERGPSRVRRRASTYVGQAEAGLGGEPRRPD